MQVIQIGTSRPSFDGFTFLAFQTLFQDTTLSDQEDSQISSSRFSPPKATAFGMRGSSGRCEGWMAKAATEPSEGENV